ncbi:S-adenosyl-L-methionine-dependent methyltransferase [Xylariaceae sp. FL0255]|nr:S-adenosyl-L-methionine-dependent methyltransferase [Xylariaceae sp. FL0255]
MQKIACRIKNQLIQSRLFSIPKTTSQPILPTSFRHQRKMSTHGLAFSASSGVKNQIWTDVDAYTVERTHPPSKPNHQVLLDALRNSRDKDLPDIGTAPVIAKMYALQCKAKGVKHALEFGTLGAYTSIWLATENPGIQVTTIEINEHHAAVAKENLANAGVADRVDVRLGAGLDVLPQLTKEIESGAKPKLGFVYIDADKQNNWNYMDRVIPLCEQGAYIYVDNIVRSGKILDPKNQEKNTLGARQVVEMAGKDERVDSVVLQFVGEKGWDGMVMAVVK